MDGSRYLYLVDNANWAGLSGSNLLLSNSIYPLVKNPRNNIHCFDVMLIFQINADNTYNHDQYISVWVLSMLYIQKMR